MLYILPDYYPAFHCTADACPDTCCAGWQISIDPKSLKRYRTYKGKFRPKLLRSVRWVKKTFRQDSHGRCLLLSEDNLCGIYLHMGEDSMCRTCRLYPRHIEEFENVREVPLSLSCPEAARLLLEHESPVRFREFNRPSREEAYKDFNRLLYARLCASRKKMIGILQNRRLSLVLRLGLVSWLACGLEKEWKKGTSSDWKILLEKAESGHFDEMIQKRLNTGHKSRGLWIKKMFSALKTFEILRQDWPVWIGEVQDLLYKRGWEYYEKTEKEFAQWLKEDSLDWQIPFEQLSVYFFFSYFCGSVYNGEISACAQLAAVHTWLLWEMLKACWLRNEKTLCLEDLTDLACRYSRELEHSASNQKHMEAFMIQNRFSNTL